MANPTYDELVSRLERMEAMMEQGGIPLDALPMNALSNRLAETMVPEGDSHLLPHSAGPDSLSAMPAATIRRSAAIALTVGAHTCLPMDTIAFQQGVQINLALLPTRITIVTPGLYWIGGHMSIVDASYSSLSLVVSGRGIVADEGGTSTAYRLRTASAIEVLKAGDYVELDYYATPAANGPYPGGGVSGCMTVADNRIPRLSVAYLSYVEGL